MAILLHFVKSNFKKMSAKDKDTVQEDIQNAEANAQEQTSNQVNEEVSVEEQLQNELAKEKDKFLRLYAEFENYKRRTSKERIELFKTANQDVMVAMLPILDDFERAIAQIEKTEDNELLKGVQLIQGKFTNTLKNKGLEPVEASAGDTFDADIHEAVTQIPAPTEDLKGKVVDVIERGYKLGEKVIRHPKVVVGQ